MPTMLVPCVRMRVHMLYPGRLGYQILDLTTRCTVTTWVRVRLEFQPVLHHVRDWITFCHNMYYALFPARQVPLALMEEGLVDATVVAGVLCPKGKASPEDEPLFKVQKAATTFRDMRAEIVRTLKARAFTRHCFQRPIYTRSFLGNLAIFSFSSPA